MTLVIDALDLAREALEVEQVAVTLFNLVPKPHITKALTAIEQTRADHTEDNLEMVAANGQGPVALEIGGKQLTLGEALDEAIAATERSASKRLNAVLVAAKNALYTTPPAQPAPDDLDRNACEELNCAEELLDGMSVDLDMEQTDFDCIGDYIKAVFAAQAKHLITPAAQRQSNDLADDEVLKIFGQFTAMTGKGWLDLYRMTEDRRKGKKI
jgi:hypothetical protein